MNGIVAIGTRISAQHFLGLADFKLVDGNLAAVWKGNCQCLIHYLCIVPNNEVIVHIFHIIPIAFLRLQRAAGQTEQISSHCHRFLHFQVDVV